MSNIVVYTDELKAATNCFSSPDNPLKCDSNDSNSMNETLDDFIENSINSLTGEGWDSVRNKLGEYNTLLVQRMNVASRLGEAIQNALKLLTDYIGDYESLDTSKLEEIKLARNECYSNICSLENMLKQTREIEVDGVKKVVNVYDAGAINAKLNNLRNALLELDNLIKKIEGLDEIYLKAEQMLKDAFADVESFGSSVSNIVPTKEMHFVPVQNNIGFSPIIPIPNE